MNPNCKASPPCTFRTVPLEEVRLQWGGEAIGRKAVAIPATRTIYIDPAFWATLNYLHGRAIIFCHEWAHLEGARCENCADYRGGSLLHRLGVPTSRDAQRAMLAALDHRDPALAASQVAKGYGVDDLPAVTMVDGYRDGVKFALQVVEVAPGKFLSAAAAPSWKALEAWAHAEGIGYEGIESAWRDNADQTRLYAGFKAGLPGFNPADPPGYSKHQDGSAIDGKWKNEVERERFAAGAGRFGWERNVSREPWHFHWRGTGEGVAVAQRDTLGLLGIAITLLSGVLG